MSQICDDSIFCIRGWLSNDVPIQSGGDAGYSSQSTELSCVRGARARHETFEYNAIAAKRHISTRNQYFEERTRTCQRELIIAA